MKHILILFLSFIFLIRTNAQINVQGTVTASDTEEFLIGVTVMLKGTNRGTATDISGKYEILVPPDGVLVFSYI